MHKVLFLGYEERTQLIKSINQRLETKNRLLNLIIMNPDKNNSPAIRSKKINRYEDQIQILQSILSQINKCRTRADIQDLNKMIEIYNESERILD